MKRTRSVVVESNESFHCALKNMDIVIKILLIAYSLIERNSNALFFLYRWTRVLFPLQYMEIFRELFPQLCFISNPTNIRLPESVLIRAKNLRQMRLFSYERNEFDLLAHFSFLERLCFIRKTFDQIPQSLSLSKLKYLKTMKFINCRAVVIDFREIHLLSLVGCLRKIVIAWCTNVDIKGLCELTNLCSLKFKGHWYKFNDGDIENLFSLKSLKLPLESTITAKGIKGLTNLCRLNLDSNDTFSFGSTPNEVSYRLDKLSLNYNPSIKVLPLAILSSIKDLRISQSEFGNVTLSKMTNLTKLDLTCNSRIQARTISGLTRIQNLNLTDNDNIGNDTVKSLSNTLIKLNLSFNDFICDSTLYLLSNLRILSLYNNDIITNDGVSALTNLQVLKLRRNKFISNEGIMNLTSLTKLHIVESPFITLDGLMLLRRMRVIVIDANSHLKNSDVLLHPNRRTLWPFL